MKDINNSQEFLEHFKKADGLKIRVGVLGDGEVAEYYAANEFGTKFIPERPTLRVAFDDQKNIKEATEIARKIFDVGHDVMQVANAIGLLLSEAVRKRIRSNTPPKLKEETERRKHSTRTLIDTGRLIGSITHALV